MVQYEEVYMKIHYSPTWRFGPYSLLLLVLNGCSGANLSSMLPVMSEPEQEQPVSDSLPVPLPVVNDTAALSLLSADETLHTLDFPIQGSTTVNGRVVGYQATAYAFPIKAGQSLKISMKTSSDSVYFNIHDVRDQSGAALFAGETENRREANVNVLSNGTLLIRPFLVQAMARRGEAADYTLTIERF
jgi:hypothetical protein